jgi:hypothetical protein
MESGFRLHEGLMLILWGLQIVSTVPRMGGLYNDLDPNGIVGYEDYRTPVSPCYLVSLTTNLAWVNADRLSDRAARSTPILGRLESCRRTRILKWLSDAAQIANILTDQSYRHDTCIRSTRSRSTNTDQIRYPQQTKSNEERDPRFRGSRQHLKLNISRHGDLGYCKTRSKSQRVPKTPCRPLLRIAYFDTAHYLDNLDLDARRNHQKTPSTKSIMDTTSARLARIPQRARDRDPCSGPQSRRVHGL